MKNGNFKIIKRSSLPISARILPAVWQMKRKRDLLTRQVKKYKARLNVDGSRQRKHLDYDRTYAPVASWPAIRLLLILSSIYNWHTIQLDYVLAYPQALVERTLFMRMPKGVEVEGDNTEEHVLQIERNVYGQKQAGRVWHKHLVSKLSSIGFVQSKIDPCVFYKGRIIYVLYTDDTILAGPNKKEIDETIEQIKSAGLQITVEGSIEDFLGVRVQRNNDGSFEFTQTHLIDQITQALHIQDARPRPVPAKLETLKRGINTPPFDNSFNYRSVLGKIGYLQICTRPDIAYSAHQCARYGTAPRKIHGDALRNIGKYLLGTRKGGMLYKPDRKRGLEVHVDADFAGNWDKLDAHNPDTVRSRHGYIISYAGCPILWKSQLQSEIALSTTEAEYTGLSYSLRAAIPIMRLLAEMHKNGIKVDTAPPKITCTVFEDNAGAIEIAKHERLSPRTKHMATKLHHFRHYVDQGLIKIKHCPTKDQQADLLTKPLPNPQFASFRRMIMGW